MLLLRTIIVSLFAGVQRFAGGLTLDTVLSQSTSRADGLIDLAERGEAPPNCYITVA